jgi:hypothetical protein
MKRWLALASRHWVCCSGFIILPVGGWPDVNQVLYRTEEPREDPPSPPPYGPERVSSTRLSKTERELWKCIQGRHARCSGHDH